MKGSALVIAVVVAGCVRVIALTERLKRELTSRHAVGLANTYAHHLSRLRRDDESGVQVEHDRGREVLELG